MTEAPENPNVRKVPANAPAKKKRIRKPVAKKTVHVDAHERKAPAPKPKEKVKPKFNNEPRTNFD